jgi:thiol-disulfide isomerase/thioredoxin
MIYAGAGILLLGVVGVALWLYRHSPQDFANRNIRLQTVSLEPLLGADQPIGLENLQNKVVVLNFWGTWCPPCLLELPHLAELERKYRSREGVLFLAVSCGPGPREDLEEIRSNTAALLANQQIDLPTYVDPGFLTRRAVDEAVGFQGYPTTVLLDRQGYIRRVWVGFDRQMPEELDRLVEQLLTEVP